MPSLDASTFSVAATFPSCGRTPRSWRSAVKLRCATQRLWAGGCCAVAFDAGNPETRREISATVLSWNMERKRRDGPFGGETVEPTLFPEMKRFIDDVTAIVARGGERKLSPRASPRALSRCCGRPTFSTRDV